MKKDSKKYSTNPKPIFTIALITLALLTQQTLTYNPLKIIKLSERNIRIAIKKYQRVLILFHSKWCPFSKDAISALQNLASSKYSEELRENRIMIAHYLSRENNEILTEFNIKSYPTLRMYVEGSEIFFNRQNHDQENYINFIRGILNQKISYVENYKKLILTEKPKIVFYGSEKSFRFPIFRASMYRFPDLEFVHVVSNKKHIKKTDLKDNTINIVQKDGDLMYYRKAWEQRRVNEWIFHSLNPSVIPLNQNFVDLVVNDKNPAFLLIVSKLKKFLNFP